MDICIILLDKELFGRRKHIKLFLCINASMHCWIHKYMNWYIHTPTTSSSFFNIQLCLISNTYFHFCICLTSRPLWRKAQLTPSTVWSKFGHQGRVKGKIFLRDCIIHWKMMVIIIRGLSLLEHPHIYFHLGVPMKNIFENVSSTRRVHIQHYKSSIKVENFLTSS